MHRLSSRARALLVVHCALIAALLPHRHARAVGFELTPPGAHDVGRAGASTAGADTAMGLYYNPATLLANTSFTDTVVATQMGFTNVCYTGQAVMEDMAGNRTAGPISDKVCGDAKVSVVPATSTAFRFNVGKQRLALAFGFYAPPAAGRNTHFGDKRTGVLPDGTLSPARYMLISENILQYFPTLGGAWEPFKQLRIGASFGWGITKFDVTTGTFSHLVQTQNMPLVGNVTVDATTDAAARVKGVDGFMPRVQVGAWGQPLKNVPLELGANFTWVDQVKTSSATLQLQNVKTNYNITPASVSTLLGTLPQPALDAKVKHATFQVPAISTLDLGVRYAKKLDKPASRWGDRMANELFDVEVDGELAFTSSVHRIDVNLPPTTITVPSPRPGLAPDQHLQLPNKFTLPHHWKNQGQIRIGGDYNLWPGKLATRVGYSFESSAISSGYYQLDFVPWKRHAIYFGSTARLWDLIDISASYAVFIVPDVNNSVQQAQIRRNTAGMVQPGDNTVINAGRFTQTASMLMVDVGIHL